MVYMLGADWQADITHLVLDQLKVGPHILTYTHTYTKSSLKELFNILGNTVFIIYIICFPRVRSEDQSQYLMSVH